MRFKKINIWKHKNNTLTILGIISIWFIFILGIFVMKHIQFIDINIDNKDQIEIPVKPNYIDDKWEIQITEETQIKNDANKVNILLLWRWGWNHDAPNLTDTIILASINFEKQNINMLSIPRDLYVDYDVVWKDEEWKINWVYAYHSFNKKSKQYWIKKLKSKITEITGEKIDYYANIDFNWFVEIIDTLWWITLTLENNFIDKQYPDGNWWYTTIFFKKWTWLFDWNNTLKYVRSRHSTSDFDRSIRQQQVITAIKDKLNAWYFLKSPSKIKELYDVLLKNIDTDIPFSEMLAIAYKVKVVSNFKVISSNINDTCFYWSATCWKWWLLYVPSREFFNWMSVLLLEWTQKGNISNYKKSKIFSDIIFNNSEFFEENYTVNIFNSTKTNNLASALTNDFLKFGFNIPSTNSIWNTSEIYKKTTIYYNNIESDSITLKVLKMFFNWDIVETRYPQYSKNNAKIEVIIWQDYLLKNNKIFKF